MQANALRCLLSLTLAFVCGCAEDEPYVGPLGGSGSAGAAGAGGVAASVGGTGTAGTPPSVTPSAGAPAGGSPPTAAGAGTGGSAPQAGAAGSASGGAGGSAAVPTDGKGLYDANCRACHGEQGAGGPLAPELAHPVRDYSTWVVRNGRAQTTYPKAMDKWDATKLSDSQLKLMYDYLDQPPQPTTGKALYDDYCTACHGADGKGGPTQRPLLNEVSKVLTQVRSGKNVGKFEPRKDYMPAFPASSISDAELQLIRTYVDSL